MEVHNAVSFTARMQSELCALKACAQLRSLEINAGINLCSNDYLGLATDARLRQAAVEGVHRTLQTGATGSRLVSGNSRHWEELEEEFAEFAGTSDAVYFSSGYAANVGLLSSLLRPGDLVFSDSLNHASIIDGLRLSGASKIIYAHRDLAALREELARHREEPGCRLIITESLFSMDGDRAPLKELMALAGAHGADLIVDEAHATGVHGAQGRGLAAEAGIVNELLAVVHTCGKALASMGAFVCSGSSLKQFLVNRARSFVFSTAMPPYFAHQIRAALRIAMESGQERAALERRGQRLRRLLHEAGFDTGASSSQIIPVIVGDNQSALHFAAQLRNSGFAVRAMRPPTVPPGTSRLRLSLTSKITDGDIDKLMKALLLAREMLVCPSHA